MLLLSIGMLVYISAGLWLFPGERWQVMASVPVRRREGGGWDGLNLTWYGALSANGITAAVLLFFILSATAGLRPKTIFLVSTAVLLFSLPAGRIVAIIVEKKRNTFTTGGASFVGIIAAVPSIILVWALTGQPGEAPVLPFMAALAVAYAAGESLGRTACVSFGCCYGKKLDDINPTLRRLIAPIGIKFQGAMKKASYAGGLDGVALVPVQGITAVIYAVAAISGTALFLTGKYSLALLVSGVTVFVWRVLSEFLRADFRGFSAFTAYQKMSLAGAVGVVVLAMFFDQNVSSGAITAYDGFEKIMSVSFVMFLQGVWLSVFVFLGRSTVTGPHISLFAKE
jgi:hypothetical protein